MLGNVLFQWAIQRYELIFLDMLWNPEVTRAAVASMSLEQRAVHAWITGTLDVIYPIAFGLFLLGTGLRILPNQRRWIIAFVVIVVALDLSEGLVQILALTNIVDWLPAKLLFTPVKLGMFLVGIPLSALGWFCWFIWGRHAEGAGV